MAMHRYNKFNTKRRIERAPDVARLGELANCVKYVGSPDHKKNPGDFGLTPPSSPRLNASLCDDVKIFRVAEARQYLVDGLRQGFVSDRYDDGWPFNIWAVTEKDVPLEAEYANNGEYHGYPLLENDPFATAVLRHWRARNG